MAGGYKDAAATSAKYSETMKKEMKSSLIYKHEDGMNYAKCFERIIVGSCLQSPSDVDTLKKEGVGIVFCLQEDKDMAHFNLDLEPILARAVELDVKHVRHPIKDFDPLSLRRHVPDAVRCLAAEMAARPEALVYIHCTAGLGRAPATALAYMFLIEGKDLDEAYAELYKSRRCHPQLQMVRAAACDMLSGDMGSGQLHIAIERPKAKKVEIAGLDVGWHERIPLVKDEKTGEFVLDRETPPGVYQYKFIVDGEWLLCGRQEQILHVFLSLFFFFCVLFLPTCTEMMDLRMADPDLPGVTDNGNLNNLARVDPTPGSPDAERRSRIMRKGGQPTAEEWQQLRAMLVGPA